MPQTNWKTGLTPYLRQEPVILAILTGIAILYFIGVSALARIYSSQRTVLAQQLAADGINDLNAMRYQPAVEDFRTALEYSRDDDGYQLSLAQALIGLKRYDEAEAYLLTLRDREPDNGMVSRELARIAVIQGQTEQALRFYHNAIYGTWPGNQEEAARNARLELIRYLMNIKAWPQADAELIDLEASLGENAGDQEQLGTMFAQVGDQQRALAAFQRALRLDRHNAQALAGAGAAAYALGQYVAAQRYLEQALSGRPADTQSAALLKKIDTLLHWDPFRQQITSEERGSIAFDAFNTAGARLKTCTPMTPAIQALQQNWTKLKPQVRERKLRDDQDMVNAVMSLAFTIERQTASTCGPQTEADQDLLLVANLHEED